MEIIYANLPTCSGCFRVPDYTCKLTVSDEWPRHRLLFEQDPLPDTLLPIGVHQLVLRVTDPNGNVSTCETQIVVQCATTYLNTEQTVECPAGQTGNPVTIGAGLYSSTVSQEDANAQALAAAEAQLLCCNDTASLISGGLNDAVYDPTRNIIFATGNAGHVVALDGDTGAVLYEAFIFLPDFGEGYITYVPSTDRLYVANWMDFGNGTTDFLYELNPDDLSITNSKQASLLDANVSGIQGFRRFYHYNGLLYAEFYRTGGLRVYKITPSTLTLAGPTTNRTMNSSGTFGDLDFNSDEDHIWLTDSNSRWAERYSSDFVNVYHETAAAAVGRNFYGLAWCPWNQCVYTATASRYVIKAPKSGCPVTELDLGIAIATPYNIRYRATTKYLYVPNFAHGSVSIISPDTDVVVTVTGFTAPFDVVFTPTKAWAICHGRVGIQEIVATLPAIGAPAPDRIFTQTVPPILRAYYTFETDVPGHWPDSKGTNHLVATPGNARIAASSGDTVFAVAIQADGKVVIGGAFVNVNGTTQNRISRLNGSGYVGLDSTFATNIGTGFNTGQVQAIAIQGDGKILVGGSFTSFNGTARARICRLNSDGTLDMSFDPGAGANGTVRGIGILSSGKVVIVGDFTSVSGTAINRIALLDNHRGVLANTVIAPGTGYTSAVGVATTGGTGTGATFDTTDDGGGGIASVVLNNPGTGYTAGDILTLAGGGGDAQISVDSINSLDATFVSNVGTGINSGAVNCVAVDASDRIYFGGTTFTAYNGTTRTRIARIAGDGTLNAGYQNTLGGADADVNAIVIETGGKAIIAGNFTTLNGVSTTRIARLSDTDGSTDGTFSAGSTFTAAIHALAIQGDGKILVAGAFTLSIGGLTRGGLVRLSSAGVTDSTFATETAGQLIFNKIGFALTLGATVRAVAIQGDGKIIAGASWGSCVTRSILRYGTTGLLDLDFNPSPGVNAIANIQGNGANFNVDGVTNLCQFYGLRSPVVTDFSPDPRKGYTICFWFKWTVTGPLPGLAFQAIPSLSASFCPVPDIFISLAPLRAFADDGFLVGETATTAGEVLNTQYFVRAWVDPVDRKIRIQLNMGTVVVGTRALDQIHQEYETLGSWFAMLRNERTFILDEMAIYEGVLSDAEANYLYNGGVGRTYPDVPYP